jgi:hypothetical protein
MTLRRHSFFGIVCKLDRIPATAIRRSTRIVDEREVDELITFDQDCDGTMDGHFVIPVDLVHENPVFEAGVFIDDHP